MKTQSQSFKRPRVTFQVKRLDRPGQEPSSADKQQERLYTIVASSTILVNGIPYVNHRIITNPKDGQPFAMKENGAKILVEWLNQLKLFA